MSNKPESKIARDIEKGDVIRYGGNVCKVVHVADRRYLGLVQFVIQPSPNGELTCLTVFPTQSFRIDPPGGG